MGEGLRIESSIAKSELDNGSLASRISGRPVFMMPASYSLYLLPFGSAGAVPFPVLLAGNSSWRLAMLELFFYPILLGWSALHWLVYPYCKSAAKATRIIGQQNKRLT